MSYIPERGDIIWITLDPQAGLEQKGRRPALVISPSAYNKKVGLAICCPITSHVKGYPFEVIIPHGMPVEGAILSDQIKNLDWKAREAKKICSLSVLALDEVLQKISTLIGH